MSSRQLIDRLCSLGYPDVNSLQPESIDWAFENEATQPFLSWLCCSLSENNVVVTTSPRDLKKKKRYQSSEAAGQVLESESLEEAMSTMNIEKTQTEEELEAEVEELKTSLEKSKARKDMLVKRCNKMSLQQMDLKNRVGKMEEIEATWKRQKQQADDKCHSMNTQLGESMQELCQNVKELMNLYQVPSGGARAKHKGDNDRYFLSQLELDAFHEAEARFSKELTAFTKKQFFEGMADMAGEREETQYTLLDVSRPENLSQCKEEDNEEDGSFLADCKEFARLQKIFPRGECTRINALINAKKAASAVQEARAVLDQLKSKVFPSSPKEISSLRDRAEQTAASAKGEAAPLVSSLPDLIKELGSLQGTEILTGDYELKLRRQGYFTKSQDKVIEHLVSQRARSEFLSMLYDLELQWHQETHSLLLAAKHSLETHLANWHARMNEMEEPDLNEKKFERHVVDTRDTSTARLYQLMGSDKDDENQLYLPKEKVCARASSLKAEHKAALNKDSARNEEDFEKVKQLESCVREGESVLYAGATCCGLPSLTPPQVQAAMTQVATQLDAVQHRVVDIMAQVNSKKKDLRSNILQKKERELFILFHTNPEKLKYEVNGLAERVRAQGIQKSS